MTSKPIPSSLEDDEEDDNQISREHDKDVVGEDGFGFVWTPPVPEEEDDQDLCQQLLGMLSVVYNWEVEIVGLFGCKREHFFIGLSRQRACCCCEQSFLSDRRQVLCKDGICSHFLIPPPNLTLNFIVASTTLLKKVFAYAVLKCVFYK